MRTAALRSFYLLFCTLFLVLNVVTVHQQDLARSVLIETVPQRHTHGISLGQVVDSRSHALSHRGHDHRGDRTEQDHTPLVLGTGKTQGFVTFSPLFLERQQAVLRGIPVNPLEKPPSMSTSQA